MLSRLHAYLHSHSGRFLRGTLFVHALLLPILFVGLLHLGAGKAILALVAGYLLVTLPLILFHGRLLTHAILRLRETSQRIARGSLDQRASVETGMGEISSLAADLESLRQALLQREEDVSRRLAEEARLAHLATHDSLTGLPNRALFADRLKQVLAQAARSGQVVAVLFVDLDHFKHVNDSLGHHIGDQLLEAAAARLKGCMRTEDTLARLGGDEFTVILPHLEQPGSAAVVAENVIQHLERPFAVGDLELSISGSVGIACYPDDGTEAAELSRNADAAMYVAKRLGGHRYQFYSRSMNAETASRADLDAGLRHAVERGELLLHYQPQVDARSLEVVGVEALLRWQHPLRGVISPDEFIALAQQSGAIVPICEWVLAAACRQGRNWQDAGLAVPISVNLAGCRLRHPNLFQAIHSALAESGFRPELLELEITEGMLAADGDESAALLPRLKKLGIVLSLDNFGTDNASLRHLREWPIDILKIDRVLIHDIGGRDDGAFAGALVALAHSLRMKTIAEGVETEEQRTRLQASGCDALQGFYFSRPLPASELTELLRRNFRPAAVAGLFGKFA